MKDMTDDMNEEMTDKTDETDKTDKTDKTKSTNSGVPLSLAGRTALITGGSRGIGAATVRLFRQAGARVAFSYQSAIGQAQALSAECGGPSLCLPIQQSLDTVEDGQ